MTTPVPRRLLKVAVLPCLIAFLPGCGARGPDTEYGSSRGTSINGTSAFAAMLRQRGHEVRPAIRLTEELSEWAQGIVRFAPYPGPPEAKEAEWYRQWLAGDHQRWLIYVVRDFDAQVEYWTQVRDGISKAADPERYDEAEAKRVAAAIETTSPHKKQEKTGNPHDWFKTDAVSSMPKICTKLEGPWAEDIDAPAAALSLHDALISDDRSVLLSGEGKPLVLDKRAVFAGNILIIANGSFLLNEALVKPARRPLALRVAEWPDREQQQIAMIESSYVTSDEEETTTLWKLLERMLSFRWVAIQMAIAGVFAALARAPRLGRPRPDPPSGADRPAAHAEALGALLARGRATTESIELLERYRQWRWPHTFLPSARSESQGRPGTTDAKVEAAAESPPANSDQPAADSGIRLGPLEITGPDGQSS